MAKTINVTFTAASPAPALGYEVMYRDSKSSVWNQLTPNPMGSPAIIPNLPDGKKWIGTIRSVCSTATKSPIQNWEVDDRTALSFISQFAESEVLVCSAGLDQFWFAASEVADPDAEPYALSVGMTLYFDFGLTNLIGDGFILDSGGTIFQVTAGEIVAATGNSC